MKDPKSFIAAVLIFAGCMTTGFWIARHKVLWNDEYFSEVASVYDTSLKDQLTGHIPRSEGGNAPLFYSSQKLFLQLIGYQMPPQWQDGKWSSDPRSQMVLRITSVIFMSLSVALVFYYFCRCYSWAAGLLSTLIYLSSYMLWVYWAEARPYALMVFLTTVQSIILLARMDQCPRRDTGGLWVMMAVTNILLAMTSVISLGEIAAASVVWWVLNERDWRRYLAMTGIPAAVVLFYYAHATKIQFYFDLTPEQLIRDNVARECFYLLFAFLILSAIYWLGQKNRKIEQVLSKEILKPLPYILLMGLMLAASAVLLGSIAMHVKAGAFPVTSRYFIYLTPVGVIATTIVSVTLWRSFAGHRAVQWVSAVLIGLLLVHHFLKVVSPQIHSFMAG